MCLKDVDPEDPADPQSLSEREMRVSEEEKEWTWTIELAEEFGELETDSSNEEVAVYSRQELNKHLMASYLIALAAYLPASKPHVRRYFCAAVRLPSDWLQVPRIYSTVSWRISHQLSSLPTCLKKGLVDKFKQFSESQLAKYCTRRRRKHKAAVQHLHTTKRKTRPLKEYFCASFKLCFICVKFSVYKKVMGNRLGVIMGV
uniref:TROVE domain-containing protein n=1 Tax=Astyanax mexicanus TaxID=7994 RepID=A0A3B1IC00_ASTMX